MGAIDVKKIPVLSGIFGGSPDVKAVDLDQGTKDLIHNAVGRATNETPQDIQGQILNGVGGANEGMSQTPEQLGQEAVRTGQDPALMQAISNRYRQMNTQDLDRFKNQSDVQSRYLKGQRMAQISQAAMAQQQVQTNNYAMLSQAYQANEAARAEVVSNIIGAGSQMYAMGQAGNNVATRNPNYKQEMQQNMNQFNTGGAFPGSNSSDYSNL